jgi:hypothetical protein
MRMARMRRADINLKKCESSPSLTYGDITNSDVMPIRGREQRRRQQDEADIRE